MFTPGYLDAFSILLHHPLPPPPHHPPVPQAPANQHYYDNQTPTKCRCQDKLLT